MTSSITTDLYPCLRGEAIAKQGFGAIYLSQFRALISAPPDRYATLYRPLCTALWNYVRRCHVLRHVKIIKSPLSALTVY